MHLEISCTDSISETLSMFIGAEHCEASRPHIPQELICSYGYFLCIEARLSQAPLSRLSYSTKASRRFEVRYIANSVQQKIKTPAAITAIRHSGAWRAVSLTIELTAKPKIADSERTAMETTAHLGIWPPSCLLN